MSSMSSSLRRSINSIFLAIVISPAYTLAQAQVTGVSGNDGSLTPAPSTSVALIILYSVTGIITALFLLIIVTGAVRAHRHPERYGPRAIARFGRPRQSRAKGLARAVLDTIPIVRFGGVEGDVEKGKTEGEGEGEVEMKDKVEDGVENKEKKEGETAEKKDEQDNKETDEVTEIQAEGSHAKEITVASSPERRMSNESARAVNGTDTPDFPPALTTPTTPTTPTSSTIPAIPSAATIENITSQNNCPVCMEDFEQGQDVRVLPCSHNFHPDCIDPWLLNVSGSCPLCRIDLHPEEPEEEEPAAPQPAPTQPSRLSRYLEMARGSSGDERMAALRQLREEERTRRRQERRRSGGARRLSRVLTGRS